MTRISALVLAALLVLSLPVASAGSTAPAVAEPATATEDTSAPTVVATAGDSDISWVTVDGERATTSYGEADADLASTIGGSDARLRTEFSATRIERRYERAVTPEQRRSVINQSVADVEDRILALHEREQRAAQAFARGVITEEQLLGELARIYHEASALESQAATISRLADDEQARSIRLNGRLSRFQSPLRADVARAHSAESSAVGPIQVTADGDRLVLARIEGDTYLREAVQFDAYEHDGEIRFESLLDVNEGMDVSERGAELYPWIYSNSWNDNSHRWYNSLMWARIEHEKGVLQTYIDGTSRDVVLEYHTLAIDELDRTPTVRQTGENVSIAAHRVPSGGPIWVNVTDPDSGDSLDANVTVGDHTVRAGDDGTVWIPAHEGTVRVTAAVDDRTAAGAENVSVTVREPAG